MSTDLTTHIADVICDFDGRFQLSRDGLATLVVRRLHDKGVIRLDQVRPVGAFIAANANTDPQELAAALVAEFQLGGADQ